MSGFKSSTTSGMKTIKEEEPTSKVEGKPAQAKDKVRSEGKVRISLPTRTPEEKKQLMANNQCFKCGEVGHRFYQCPKKRTSEDSKEETQGTEDTKNKKSQPSAGLIPDMVGEQQPGSRDRVM